MGSFIETPRISRYNLAKGVLDRYDDREVTYDYIELVANQSVTTPLARVIALRWIRMIEGNHYGFIDVIAQARRITRLEKSQEPKRRISSLPIKRPKNLSEDRKFHREAKRFVLIQTLDGNWGVRDLMSIGPWPWRFNLTKEKAIEMADERNNRQGWSLDLWDRLSGRTQGTVDYIRRQEEEEMKEGN